MKNYFWLVGAMVLALSLGLTVQVVAQADHESVSVLISFTDMPGQAEEAMVLAFGGEIKQSFTLVPVIAADIPQAAMRGLSRHPMVTTVELDGQFKVPESQAHSDTELTNTWGVERIGAGQAHHEGYIGAGARVAVLDTGLAVDHSDLSYDPNCSASFVPDQTINDGHGHGTHVAGTIAALADGVGVVGVGPDVTICVLKVLGDEGGGSFSYVIAALEYLVDYNQANPEAQVLVTNNSYGSRTNPGSIVESTFEAAASAGILHVAAAGNDGNVRGNGNNVIYPARYDSVIAVAVEMAGNNIQDSYRSGGSGPDVVLLQTPTTTNGDALTAMNSAERVVCDNAVSSAEVEGEFSDSCPATGQITSPTDNEVVIDTLDLAAHYTGDPADDVFWAVRQGTCEAGTDTVLGNVDGFSDQYEWENGEFSASFDVSGFDEGGYCFIFNPGGNQNEVRETVEFSIETPATPDPEPEDPSDKDQCKEGGWEEFGFRNQGQCIRFVNTDQDSR